MVVSEQEKLHFFYEQKVDCCYIQPSDLLYRVNDDEQSFYAGFYHYQRLGVCCAGRFRRICIGWYARP